MLFLNTACENSAFLQAIYIVKEIMNVAFLLIPMGLIVMISVDFFQGVISKEDDLKNNKAMKIAFKRVLMCIGLFLVPTIVNLMMGLLSDASINISIDECWNNATPSKIKVFAEMEKKLMAAEEKERLDNIKKNMKSDPKIEKKTITDNNSDNNSSNGAGAGISNSNNTSSSDVVDSSEVSATAQEFINLLDKYSDYIKNNSKHFKNSNEHNPTTFGSVKSRVNNGGSVNVNCVSPTMWGLRKMKLINSNFYSTTNGVFRGSTTGKFNKKLTKITNLNGMLLKDAAKKDLLKPGDIISNATFDHTFVYAGYKDGKVYVYEAGGNAKGKGYGNIGCGPFTVGQYNKKKKNPDKPKSYIEIASVLRWND